jgi:hypothetical protein
MHKSSTIAAVLAMAIGGVGSAFAHHSGAMFDRSQVVSLEAVVVEWSWTNPHSWLQVSAEHNGEANVLWSFESTSTQILAKQGWRRTSLVPGDKVVVEYNPFRDGAPGGNLVRVTKQDGTVLGPPARPLPAGVN